MARAALKWSRAELAQAAGIGVATVVRFEAGTPVNDDSVLALRHALEKARCKFVEDGPMKGVVFGG
jgi:transcriptional regulator with XRE-family HTH domain